MTLKDKNLYYIGGVVRDEILELPSFDTDFCYEGNAIEFSRKLQVIKTNPKFGTVRVIIDGKEIDIASTRTEIYPQAGHLPLVDKIGCPLIEDLSRRDFTINAMAKNTLTGEVIDHFNGLEDIKNKKIRVLHNKSFIDDPSRILRGLKFSVRFNFELEETTKKLQNEYLANINYDMSYHRIKKELKETFNLNKQIAYEKFISQGIYKLLSKNAEPIELTSSIENLINQYKPDNIWLVYLGMFDLSNFELNSEETDIINDFNKIKNITFNSDYEIYKAFKNIPLESILLYCVVKNPDIGLHYLNKLAKIKIETTGNDLQNIGIKQGKVYKEIFEYLESEKIKNPKLTKNDEIKLIKDKYFVKKTL